ncbi:unnamed protein product [Rhizoctonia solani]|uniref:Uncharacterized protein n=1 Tax=Rhizoctonia solani TaxID=456999 RepID=A0A8H2WUN1_9AGAM|nr:unnamed protein product [Rhizoctonia solani]
MNTDVVGTDDFELELLEAQAGNISSDQFDQLLAQLKKSHSLDHIAQPAFGTALGELDVVYVVLRQGYLTELDENGSFVYTGVMKGATDYWLAGFGSLRFPNAWCGDESTADITVSLLPRAQGMGGGRFVVEKLMQHAFGTLRVRRVTASVICPIQPHHSAERNKQILFNTKQLCWIFEKFGFGFEGVTRGAVESPIAAEGGAPVWHDVHRLSILLIDYLSKGTAPIFSSSPAIRQGESEPVSKTSPWESMMQRQQEEKREMESWATEPQAVSGIEEGYDYDEEESDDETVQGDDSDSDWEMPEDFDD